ncbi:uncharacterized protein LOC117549075 [Gymnodraco acuticeps]|uniref:Uncharacterized protein LOC117549075 n=1 Tax=Gymnodraco acuticeps TaxID=8218 RepID=A0A6P8UHG1_GYMAC|nr:uncharacterized protein LOC117549075 [Gymnodraco acuticeps]
MAIGCPICKSSYRTLSKHLQRKHSVRNVVERKILLLLAKGRTNIRLHPCTIAGCEYIGTRLNRHLGWGGTRAGVSKETTPNRINTKEAVQVQRSLLQQVPHSLLQQVPHSLLQQYPIASHTPVSSSSEPASIDTEASSTSPPIHSPWFSGRGRGNIMRDITFPRIMEEYLQGYREHYEGIDPTVRLQENAVSKISRVKSFLSFMAHGFNLLSDWLFLRDLKRIRGWSRSLIKSSLQVTTADFYIKNISHFLKYMSATPCKGSRLNQNDMTVIKRELVAILKSLRKKMIIHQMQVKRDKMEGLPSYKDIMACLTAAKSRIPQLLDVMASNPTTATRLLLYGYMTLHWSCIYGHRPGVYSNMTNTEVRKAETTGTAFGYLIHTANAFGEAQLYLTIEEFGWMKRWLEIKGTLTCTQNRYFLYTAGKNPSRNLAYFLRLAWADVGLQGPINFTNLRTVHADNAKRFQDISNRQRVSDFMCHNTATADTFYAKNPSLKDAADIRLLFTESLPAAAAAAGGSEENVGDIDSDSSGEEHSPTPSQDFPDAETSGE